MEPINQFSSLVSFSDGFGFLLNYKKQNIVILCLLWKIFLSCGHYSTIFIKVKDMQVKHGQVHSQTR